MTEERAKRKLSAVLSADVKGYSRLMGMDETGTISRLKEYRALMTDLIQQYRGRVVDSPGDNMLSEFSSVIDATECAVKIQEELKKKNAELPDDRKMEFRIGINLGDIIEDEKRIYGDGVNVAARIESLAAAGGICISRTAFDQIKNKLELGYEYLGEHSVKNIAEPVRVYRVLMEPEAAGTVIGEKRKAKKWLVLTAAVVFIVAIGSVLSWYLYKHKYSKIEPASLDKMAFSLPDKPSIAVLPFDNLSGDPKQESLADGISESIITALSYIPDMFVIARNSTFTYRGKPVKIRQVAEELGVRYVLEGSVLKAEDQVRVTAQLIDATTGYHLWSKSYDRTINDLFALLDDITKSIAIELQIQISDKVAQLSGKTNSLDAWAFTTEAYTLITRLGKGNITRARELTEKAVNLDSEYGYAWSILAAAHFWDAAFGYSQSKSASFNKAVEFNSKALELDDTLSCAMALQALIYRAQGKLEEAIYAVKKSINMSPSVDANYAMAAGIMYYAGRFDEAIALFKNAMRLNPYYPAIYLRGIGISYLLAGHNEEALETYKQLLKRAEKGEFPPIFAHLGLSAVYAELDKKEEASNHTSEILKINPRFSLEAAKTVYSFNSPQHSEQWFSALRKAGLPEHPPLQLPDRPSLAVLAFDNMSGDPKQDYFGDGIAEEIITALSKSNDLFVIARNSSFTFKGKPVKIQQVSKELGVRYVLEGSFKRSGDRLRITAQLIDAVNGQHLWAERYDRKLTDIFEIQDDITKRIIASLKVKLTIGESARVYAKGTNNLDAYLKVMQAWHYHMLFTKEDNYISRGLAEEGIAMDPKYASAYVLLAATYMLDTFLGDVKNRKQNLGKAIELAKQAVALEYVGGYAMLGYLYSLTGQADKAIAECKKAVELDPNASLARAWYGAVLYKAGQYKAAVQELEQSVRRDPMAGTWVLRFLGSAYSFARRHDEAITTLKKAIQKAPNDHLSRLMIIRAYIFAGRQEEAETEAAEVLRLDPKFSLENYTKRMTGKDKERSLEAFRRAGLK